MTTSARPTGRDVVTAATEPPVSPAVPDAAGRTAPVPRRRRSPRELVSAASVAVVTVAALVLAWRGTDFSIAALVDGREGIARFVSEAFPPDLTWDTVVKPGLQATLVTLWIGLLGTALSVPFSLVLAVLGARTTSPHPAVYQAARAVLSFLRAVPDVVFALVFVTAVGLGPFSGVLALIVHNTGVMGKLWAEAMEETDQGPSQALRTAGAGRTQVVTHAVLPGVAPQMVGLTLYRFDVNVRASLVLGLVGAGGIGFLITKAIKMFEFGQMLTYILMVLVLVWLVDRFSSWARARFAA
ncbi:phosphonate ABC transporter, permease protein PhnE [Luteimicrobium sp. DT211]|uniref:phosphonate ABC transporter, permease protein PhnE n=1 Tax=Luteimicrobium sp. DT211 TaxID=3393412 RepID=UPI003CF61E58